LKGYTLSPSENTDFIRFSEPEGPDLLISLCSAGDMGIDNPSSLENRNNFFRRLGIAERKTAARKQVHSQDITIIRETLPPVSRAGDGFITDNRELLLSVTVADCLPVFIFSKKHKVFGILHSGWKGTGIAERAVGIFSQEFGIKPRELTVLMGPGIGPCCYRVDKDRADFFQNNYGPSAVQFHSGKPHVDLREANRIICERTGVRDIRSFTNCTSCETIFGSFRRQGPDEFIRMVALIGYFL